MVFACPPISLSLVVVYFLCNRCLLITGVNPLEGIPPMTRVFQPHTLIATSPVTPVCSLGRLLVIIVAVLPALGHVIRIVDHMTEQTCLLGHTIGISSHMIIGCRRNGREAVIVRRMVVCGRSMRAPRAECITTTRWRTSRSGKNQKASLRSRLSIDPYLWQNLLILGTVSNHTLTQPL